MVPAEEKPLTAVLDAVERASQFGKLARERVGQALARVQKAGRGLSLPRKEVNEREVSLLARHFERFWKQHGRLD